MSFRTILSSITGFLKKEELRLWILMAVVVIAGCGLIYRLFDLQIVKGASYLNNFQLKIRRDISTAGTRGLIYDRNGKVLAYNELAYSVVFRDSGDSSTSHDYSLNDSLNNAIQIIEDNGDSLSVSFGITYDSDHDQYEFAYSGSQLLRFKADIYGYPDIEDLSEEEKNSSADDMITSLCERYHIGRKMNQSDGTTAFLPGYGMEKKRILDIVNIRYLLSLNSYQKYIATTIAQDVSDKTVAAILENKNICEGADIEEGTVRRYNDSVYFSHILGYTGQVDTTELAELYRQNPSYDGSDVVGKSGIEKSYELELQGTKGSKTVYVDSLGNEIETGNIVQPVAGNDIYLTIDSDLQEAAYEILEKKLADIILAKIRDVKEYTPTGDSQKTAVIIPIYDVYYSVINNSVLDIDHFAADDAGPVEKEVYSSYCDYSIVVYGKVETQLSDTAFPYNELSREFKNYETYIVKMLYNNGILVRSRIDESDSTYQAWTTNEEISMAQFLNYAVIQNWVDVTLLDLDNTYASSEEVYSALTKYINDYIRTDRDFTKMIYKYMLLNDTISGKQICNLLIEQNACNVPENEAQKLQDGKESAYQFMCNRISARDLTPAQLNLDPYSGSMVITDPNTGEVLALVSYPSFDNNLMANGVDPDYYEKLRNDLSKPLINYATQQRTAPGSTFKPVTATAGLMEGVIDLDTEIVCQGIFTKLSDSKPRCWVWPGGHDEQVLTQAIRNSCNVFFYDVGYRLGTENETIPLNNNLGLETLRKYAEMYGLGEKSGIEIEEAEPIISNQDTVRSAIGQGNANYTTVGLARYVSTIANSGTCYDLTLVDKIYNTNGQLLEDNTANVRNVINMDQTYWDAIHEGMRGVVRDKVYFNNLPVNVAGKTGTAQENTLRADHALFVCYAPYEAPQIAVATRVANGYKSDYAAQITEEVLEYYFNIKDKEDILSKESSVITTDDGD